MAAGILPVVDILPAEDLTANRLPYIFSMRHILISGFILCSVIANSQNEVDALRYSNIGFGGTARSTSMAGAISALGADPSCSAINPAGFGRFTRSEFSFGLNYFDIQSNTSFNGSSSLGGRANLNVANFALIGSSEPQNSEDWKRIQFGISYQRYANFNNKITINGDNNSSMLDAFVAEANGTAEANLLDEKPFYSGPAYWAYLIDPISPGNNTYSSQIPDSRVHQTRSITRIGSIGETNFTLSGNYLDKLYFGGSIGLPSVRYQDKYSHEETPLDSSLSLTGFTFDESLVTRGLGINFKAGILFSATEWLRLGLALHTPTGIGLSDRWSTTVSSEFSNGDQYSETSILGSYSYHLRTPGRVIFSTAFIIKKQGSVSVDFERVNYSKAKLRADKFETNPYPFTLENNAVLTNYQSASNIRIGAEWRFIPIYLRAGYAIYGTPFKNGVSISDASRTYITGGVGYRNRIFYVDLAYVNGKWKEDYYMYNAALTNPAQVSNTTHSIVLTAGINF